MITGDYPNTARAIAEEIGLLQAGHKVMTGADINHLSDEEMIQNVMETDVYARVSLSIRCGLWMPCVPMMKWLL